MEGSKFAQKETILESNLDVESWRLELERVLPQLKVVVKTGNQNLSNNYVCCYTAKRTHNIWHGIYVILIFRFKRLEGTLGTNEKIQGHDSERNVWNKRTT
jgi:hypothetical protein